MIYRVIIRRLHYCWLIVERAERKSVVCRILRTINEYAMLDGKIHLPVLLNLNRALISWAYYKGKPNSFSVLDLVNIGENNKELRQDILTFYDLWRQEVFNISLSLTEVIERWKAELRL